jgi:signal transduction histidine kinase
LQPTAERFTILHDEAQHLQRLIEDLRTLSLADAGELTLSRKPIAPVALLQRIADTYSHQAEQLGIALHVDAPPDLPEISVDAERMVQVLSNLVSNALRYTPAGGEIILSAGQDADAVMLAVRDTGQGILPDALPRIFDRFYRADAARAVAGRIWSGTGHRQSHRRGARWDDRRRQRAGQRCNLYNHFSTVKKNPCLPEFELIPI